MMQTGTRQATRFVEALREGGSLPGLMETDDGLYVVKFRGAGQGPKALVAEIIVGELARALGLLIPPIALVELPREIGLNESHDEVRDLLLQSVGLNVGLRFLPRALMFDPAAGQWPSAEVGSRIVMLDAFVMNVDRTARNPNLVWSDGALYCIDHGAALLWHHGWDGGLAGHDRPFPLIRQHVLLPVADDLTAAADHLTSTLDDAVLRRAVEAVPLEWLGVEPDAYIRFLSARRQTSAFLEEAIGARKGV